MIYIFDNGMSYSDHSITFVSTDGYDEKDAETLLRRAFHFNNVAPYNPDDPDEGLEIGFLVAKVEKVEWFSGKPQPLSEACHWRWRVRDPTDHFDPLKIQTVEKLYEEWIKDLENDTERWRKNYASHPQPKVAAQLLENHLNHYEVDRKLLTEAMDAYLAQRRGS
jgi:hypothetical protein